MPNSGAPYERELGYKRSPFARLLLLTCAMAIVAVTQGCASLPPIDKMASKAIASSADTELGKIAAASVAPVGATGFRALPISSFSMDARLALMAAAQSSIDLQYYLFQDDATGMTLMRAIRDAAARGVRVRVLVDDMYTTDSARVLRDLAAFDNVEVRLFNPFPTGRALMLTRWTFSLFDFARVNHRMHNKMLVADGAFAVAGGRNIANEYFFRNDKSNFIDFDLLLAGKAVADLAEIFDVYWNSPHAYPIQAIEATSQDPPTLRADFERRSGTRGAVFERPAPELRDILGYAALSRDLEHPPLDLLRGAVRVFSDDPEKVAGRSETGDDPTTVTARAMTAFAGAKFELTLCSPYFVPGEVGMKALRAARDRNVVTTIITNSLAANDEPFASAAYARYRKPMLKMGVEIYEISSRPAELAKHYGATVASIGRSHAKIAVVDRHITLLGSMNMDFRSARINTELGILVESTELAEQVQRLLEAISATDAFHVTLEQPDDRLKWSITEHRATTEYSDEPDANFATRLKMLLFSPLVPEGLL